LSCGATTNTCLLRTEGISGAASQIYNARFSGRRYNEFESITSIKFLPIVLTVTHTLFWIGSPFGHVQKPLAQTEFPVHSTMAIELSGLSQLCPGSAEII
jgi:hypothetical protein